MLFKDARDCQILFLSVFLCLGVATRDWTVKPLFVAVVMVTCLLTQFCLPHFFDFVKKVGNYKISYLTIDYRYYRLMTFLSTSAWKSALITALGLSLLLRANSMSTMVLAGFCAIASKFIFQFRGKHFFNPANFGIIVALIFTQDAWVSPGQWGTDWWYLLLFLGLGGIVLKRVGRWETSVVFLMAYTGLEAIRNAWLGWGWDVLQHHLMSGSLLLFALFMLTDPRSIPNATFSRIIWSVVIAVLTFVLQHQFYLSTAIFWALLLVSPLTIVLDSQWKAPRFMWQAKQLDLVNFEGVKL